MGQSNVFYLLMPNGTRRDTPWIERVLWQIDGHDDVDAQMNDAARAHGRGCHGNEAGLGLNSRHPNDRSDLSHRHNRSLIQQHICGVCCTQMHWMTTHWRFALYAHLREFDALDGWVNSGFGSTAAWLAWRIDIGIVAAREHVRVARALGQLKLIDNAFAAGS